jgi:hypothetical protein
MRNIKETIINKEIREIYYSDSYMKTVFTVFIYLKNGERFRLSGYGASYTDIDKKFTDLYPINVNENIISRNDFIGKKIKDIISNDDEWSYIVLENGIEILAVNDFLDRSLKIGHYTWIPNDEFLAQKSGVANYEKFIEFFCTNRLEGNLEVFDFFDILNPKDKILILEKVLEYGGEHRYSVYRILSESYAKIGENDKALKIFDYIQRVVLGGTAINSLSARAARENLSETLIGKTKSKSKQKNKIKNLIKELDINYETKAMIKLLKEFLKKKD